MCKVTPGGRVWMSAYVELVDGTSGTSCVVGYK